MGDTTAETPTAVLVQPYSNPSPGVASLRIPTGPAKLHPSLPNRPVDIEISQAIMRDLWDTRKGMVALQDREIDLIASPRSLDAPLRTLDAESAQLGRTGEYFQVTSIPSLR